MKACWHGSSLTVGEGFAPAVRDQFVYDRLVSKRLKFDSDNFARPGNSNLNIFKSACKSIICSQYDIIFVQWTVLSRLWLYPGPDTELLVTGPAKDAYQYREIFLSRTKRMALRDQLLMLNHDFQNLLDLIDFCNILQTLAESCRCKLVLINGNIPWTDDLQQPFEIHDITNMMSAYTKTMLDFDNRNDEEIIGFFCKLRNSFSSLDTGLWVNLFRSFGEMAVDLGPEGHHPGIQSHALMADLITQHLLSKGISN